MSTFQRFLVQKSEIRNQHSEIKFRTRCGELFTAEARNTRHDFSRGVRCHSDMGVDQRLRKATSVMLPITSGLCNNNFVR